MVYMPPGQENEMHIPFTDIEVVIRGRITSGDMVELSIPKLIIKSPENFVFIQSTEYESAIHNPTSLTMRAYHTLKMSFEGTPISDPDDQIFYVRVVE